MDPLASTTETILPESRTLLPLEDDIHQSLLRLSRLSFITPISSTPISLIPASPASPLSPASTPDQPIQFLRYALSELPFSFPLPSDNERQSLKTVVAKLLTRQTGRKADFYKLWEIIPSPIHQPMHIQTTDVIETFIVKFAGIVMPGIYLRYVPNEHGTNKMCRFGCTSKGDIIYFKLKVPPPCSKVPYL